MNGWLKVVSETVNSVQVTLELPGIESLPPVAIICGVCMLLTALWILAIGKYIWSRENIRSKP